MYLNTFGALHNKGIWCIKIIALAYNYHIIVIVAVIIM